MILDKPMRSCRCIFSGCCVIGIAFFLVGCGQGTSEPAQLSKPSEQRTGEPAQLSTPEEAQSANDVQLNDRAQTPDASGVEPGTELTEANFERTLRETAAKYIVIQVYMEACGPCMTEALHLTEKQDEWRKSGIAILGMGMDETPEGPKAFYRHTGERITYPLYLAPWFSEQQEVFTTPTLFIYGADGEQLFRTDPETAEEGIMAALGTKLSQLLRE